MSKKDYERLAGVIRIERMSTAENAGIILDVFAMNLADTLEEDNPNFSRARFLAACRGEDAKDSAGRKVRYSVKYRDINNAPGR
jgi:hypothetical protein